MRCFILGDLASGMPLFGSRSVVTTAFGDVWNLGTVLFLIFESEVRASNTSRAIFPIPPFLPNHMCLRCITQRHPTTDGQNKRRNRLPGLDSADSTVGSRRPTGYDRSR